jgi:hypothetical protein
MFEGSCRLRPRGAELKAKLNDTTRAQLLRGDAEPEERAKR